MKLHTENSNQSSSVRLKANEPDFLVRTSEYTSGVCTLPYEFRYESDQLLVNDFELWKGVTRPIVPGLLKL